MCARRVEEFAKSEGRCTPAASHIRVLQLPTCKAQVFYLALRDDISPTPVGPITELVLLEQPPHSCLHRFSLDATLTLQQLDSKKGKEKKKKRKYCCHLTLHPPDSPATLPRCSSPTYCVMRLSAPTRLNPPPPRAQTHDLRRRVARQLCPISAVPCADCRQDIDMCLHMHMYMAHTPLQSSYRNNCIIDMQTCPSRASQNKYTYTPPRFLSIHQSKFLGSFHSFTEQDRKTSRLAAASQ